ncbi:hypothetical protein [Desulforamulus ruminis]|uniref:Uncharacterized protein n=1 Tax=Desulforamulus ruminis (strain ATCC 23193 / DSM 2154 / NCIMB 8452 / DL) TaxID=696281 RepID=F6DLE0_DESRL|nr:hypothetical protein [Desulforamulus ruminis]AEG60488.1 hypothetical protein Desru_2239 [Desulforamulus ruminis DSM 2154]
MKEIFLMIVQIGVVLLGIGLIGAGAFYLAKEKNDPAAKKIYGTTIGIGIITLVFAAVKLF